MKNWLVRVYNSKDEIISSWPINNRTEHEASKEAEADIRKQKKYADWTMTEIT